MTDKDVFSGDNDAAIRLACIRVARRALERAANYPLRASTYVAISLEQSPVPYAPSDLASLPANELVDLARDYAYVFEVYPANVQALGRIPFGQATGTGSALGVVVQCMSAEGCWGLACGLRAEGLDADGATFFRMLRIEPLESAVIPASIACSIPPHPSLVKVDTGNEPDGIDSFAVETTPDSKFTGKGSTAPLDNTRTALSAQAASCATNHVLPDNALPLAEPWALRLMPRVLYLVSEHPVAENLLRLSMLRKGLRAPSEVFAMLSESFLPLYDRVIKELLNRLAKEDSKPVGSLKAIPSLEELARRGQKGVAPELAYWAHSEDMKPGNGKALTAIARKFGLSTAIFFETFLHRRQGALKMDASCPACEKQGSYFVSRYAPASEFISFSFKCPACQHVESYARESGWVSAVSHCPCAICESQQESVASANMPAVVKAMREVVASVHGLTAAALETFEVVTCRSATETPSRPPSSARITSSWRKSHEVRIWLKPVPGRATPPFRTFDLRWWLGHSDPGYLPHKVVDDFVSLGFRVDGYQQNVKRHRLSGLPLSDTRSRSLQCFAYDPPSLTGRALLNAQLDALSSDRLLGDDASQYQPIKVTPSVEMFCMSELSRALRLPVSHAIDVRYKGEAPPILGRLLAAFDDKANHPENFDPLADLLGDYSPAALLEALVRELGELAGKIATVSVIAAIENKFVTFNTLTLTGRLPADQERIRLRERVHSESICWRLVEFADDATVLSWAIYDWGWAFPVVHVRTLFSHRERHPSRQTRQSLYEFCEKLARNVRRFGIGLPLQMVSAAWENGIPRPA